MANLNKVLLIGRLTRDPEVRTFSNGGKVAHIGFAVNNRKKNTQTGEWEDDPVFLDCEAFNRGETGKLADNIERVKRQLVKADFTKVHPALEAEAELVEIRRQADIGGRELVAVLAAARGQRQRPA
jgi:hypothetical protein